MGRQALWGIACSSQAEKESLCLLCSSSVSPLYLKKKRKMKKRQAWRGMTGEQTKKKLWLCKYEKHVAAHIIGSCMYHLCILNKQRRRQALWQHGRGMTEWLAWRLDDICLPALSLSSVARPLSSLYKYLISSQNLYALLLNNTLSLSAMLSILK